MPMTVSVSEAPEAVVRRSLSPTFAPRSFASSMPMMMSAVPRFSLPATIFSASAITRR